MIDPVVLLFVAGVAWVAGNQIGELAADYLGFPPAPGAAYLWDLSNARPMREFAHWLIGDAWVNYRR